MTTTEIENLSHAELKERRAELVEGLEKSKPGEVYLRYVKTLTDAKARDEKLSEQGVTITNLNAGLAAERKRAEEAESKTRSIAQDLENTILTHKTMREKANAALATAAEGQEKLKVELLAAVKAIAGLQALARARREALVTVMNFAGQLQGQVAPLLAGE